MLHVLNMDLADLQGEAAPVSLGGSGGGEPPSTLAIHGQQACAVTGGWRWALLTWAVAHTVFAVIPKHEALVLLIQDHCLAIKEKAPPAKSAGLHEFLRDVVKKT